MCTLPYQLKPKRTIPELSLASMRVAYLKAGVPMKEIERRYNQQVGNRIVELVK